MQNKFSKPIIILSAPRSGSTLLFDTLSKAPDLWTIGDESHAVIEHIPELSTVQRGFVSNALAAEDATEATKTKLLTRFQQLLRDRDGDTQAQHSQQPVRFLEKTPKNSLRVEFLKQLFPDALFIYLVRDPKENINSIIEAWLSGRFLTYPNLPGFNGRWSLLLTPNWQSLKDKPLPNIAANQWAISNQAIVDGLKDIADERKLIINYRQLVDTPEAVLKQICQFADLSFDHQLSEKCRDGLPLSQYTLRAPNPDKWVPKAHVIAPELEAYTSLVAEINQWLEKDGKLKLSTDISAEQIENARQHAAAVNTINTPAPVSNPQPGTTSRNALCPCGSGKRFKHCHGAM
ncbi:sulfotransferase family protein [Thalassotalea sp. PS06]|uniref:sulfotransferase family protein n=1 Tax=Thalassotalea sp. PS06 TaxID=2594005 RepID=UPI001162850A|nr:sulfotransferase [Thalassotalea sp. PS06]QDP00513.1 zinc chelation protein SecC [Thalassotalea sp. PS06]